MMNDSISRQAAIEAMSNVTVLDKSAARRILTQLPTIEAAPIRKGKWTIEYGSDFKTYKVSRCSECGFEYGTVATRFKFCPNCGASMMEGAEE